MKKILLFTLALVVTVSGFAQKTIPLPDLLSPSTITVDDSRVYITEEHSIYIYKLKDFSLIKKFGKDGEGPGEFKILPGLPLIVNVETHRLMVNSFGKVSFFSKDGEFIEEKRVKGGFILAAQPIKNKMACWGMTFEDNTRYRTIGIYSQDLEKEKIIIKQKDTFQTPGQGLDILPAAFSFQTLDGKIFIAKEKEMVIDIYDLDGKLIRQIKNDYPLHKVTPEAKDKIMKFLKTDKSTKAQFELLKPVRFPDYFPAVLGMFAADGKLFVLTWGTETEKSECFVFDSAGDLLKKQFLDMKYVNALRPAPFAIKNGLFYQLSPDEDENWSLEISKLK